ncbi:hypothetical protein ACFFKU_04795 [Kineococcus gynurae]|uniref:Heavy metal transporter n=1 Tax=Kineococcus gynurae TaxID=452979 RepID=A0ABV5LNC0_9ACTN
MQRTRRIVAVGALALVGAGLLTWLTRDEPGPLTRERCSATVEGESTSMSPEQARNAATIVGLSVRRGLPARAATIAIATAVQESDLRNLDYGDRDSLGLFQQRPSQGWGSEAQVQDPVYATTKFYDGLEKVPGYRDLEVTDAAQRVQRSGFPLAYGDHEAEGRLVASTLTGYTAAGFTCRLHPAEDGGSGDDETLAPRAAALAEAAQVEVTTAGPRVVPGVDGRGVEFRPGGEEAPRLAWALAGWSVASAKTFDVVEVDVEGNRWTRASGEWRPTATGVPAGAVQIRTAG